MLKQTNFWMKRKRKKEEYEEIEEDIDVDDDGADNVEEKEDDDDNDDVNGEKKPVSIEDLEKRIKWLEMDAKRAKSRRSRMVRIERKMRIWQEYLDSNPQVASLELTVEHVMESMFGANGLQSLSASQIAALEDLHFAALRHLSDAKVEIAKRQVILDLKSKK